MLLAMKLMKGESDQVISDIQVSVDAERISDIIPGGIQHIIQENQDDTVEAILLKSGETPLEMVSRFKKELYQKRAYGQRLTSQSLDATPNAGYKATWMSQLPVDEDIALPTFLTPIPKSEVVAGTMDSIQFEQTPAVYDPSPNTVVANRSKPNKGEQKDGLHVLRTMDDVFDDYAKPSGLDESLLVSINCNCAINIWLFLIIMLRERSY